MFNIGFAELLLILIIAYVIVGPKDLPKVARWLARMVKRARQLIKEIKAEVGWDEMLQETEDVRKDINQTLKEAGQQLRGEIGDAKKETLQAVKEAQGKKV